MNGLFCTLSSWEEEETHKKKEKRPVLKVEKKCHADDNLERTVEHSKNSGGRRKTFISETKRESGPATISTPQAKSTHSC